MNFELEKSWRDTVAVASKHFGENLDMQSILFVLGLQELNKGYVDLTKDQKLEVMHIAICTLLEPYGYYEFMGRDEDGWPPSLRSSKVISISSTIIRHETRLMVQTTATCFGASRRK